MDGMQGLLLILLAIVVIFVFVVIIKSIIVVQQAEEMVIEYLGKYHKTLHAGLNFVVPFFEKPRALSWKETSQVGERTMSFMTVIERIDMRERVYDFPRQDVITKDNVSIQINALLYFQITDSYKVAYQIASLPQALEKLTQTTLRNLVGELDLDQTLTSRETINSKLRVILDEASNKWGVKVNRVELQDITPPAAIKEAMEKQMRAERDKRAVILEAEGMKQAQILKAEGVKESAIRQAEGERQKQILEADGLAQAKIRVAEGEAKSIQLVSETMKDFANPSQYLISLKYIDALEKMVEGKDNKLVYIPYEATGVLSAVGAVRDLLTQHHNGNIPPVAPNK